MASLKDIFSMDIHFVYGDAGVTVSYGGYTTKGILANEPMEVLQMSSKSYAIQDTTLTLSIVTGTLGVLKNNTDITVDGSGYQINKWITVGNGLETKLWILASAA